MPADDLRRYYDSLSDEGLRDINRDDLTDIARTCYDQELASRGLKIENAAAAVEPPAEGTQWVALGSFPAGEIELLRVLLDNAEIPSQLQNEQKMSPNWMGGDPGAELGLFVPEPLLEHARAVLAADVSDEDLIAEAESWQPPDDA